MSFRIAVTLVCLLTLQVACHRSWPPGTVARWDGSSVELNDIELHLKDRLDSTQAGEDLVRLYREAAEELCARDRLLRRYGADVGSHLSPADRELARRRITVAAYVRNRLVPDAEITREETEAFYTANPEYSHRPERRFVEHIFRRADAEADGVSAREVLAEVRARYLEGESFHTLAVEYSQSATGAHGGSLGLVSRGELHQAAEEAVFALEIDEISRPVEVHGGLAVFVVTQIYPEKYFSFDDVRAQIEQQLRQDQLRRRLDSIAAQATHPAGVRAVAEGAFHQSLESEDPKAVLYSDDGLEFTVDEWRQRQTGGTAEAQLAQYTDFLRLQKVYHFVVAKGFLDEAGRRELIAEQFEEDLDAQLINIIVRQRLVERATRDRKALLTWYDENHERYQSPIELQVHLIAIDPAGEVEDLIDDLRTIPPRYTGENLEQLAESFPEATVSQAWLGIAALDAYHPRVKASLVTLTPPACGPVFNIGGFLHLFCLEDRREPRQLGFEEAHDRVVDDYVAANEQDLYFEIRSGILDEADFDFNEHRVREALHTPAFQGAAAP